jgi:hypothetical protein
MLKSEAEQLFENGIYKRSRRGAVSEASMTGSPASSSRNAKVAFHVMLRHVLATLTDFCHCSQPIDPRQRFSLPL